MCEGFFEEAAAVEGEVETARQDNRSGVGGLRAEEDDGRWGSRGETGGEEAAVFGVAILPGAVDDTEAVFDLDFDGEARSVVVGELFAEALPIFGRGFGIGFETLDSGGNIGGSSGERGRELAEDGGIGARGADGTEAANELDANASTDFFSAAQEHATDLAGGANMGPAAGIAVDAFDFDEADVAGTFREFSQFAGGEHGFGFGAGDVADGDGAIFGDDFIAQALDALEAVGGDWAAGEIDGGEGVSEVEGDGGRVEFAEEDGGEQVLARVLLHVVEAAGPVDVAFDFCADRKGLADEMPDLAVVVFFYGVDGDIEGGAARRGGAKQAGIEGLAAAGGVKGGAIEGDLPDGLPFGAGEFADVSDGSGERSKEWIGVIEPFRYGHFC